MEKGYFNFITKDMEKNSVKRACYIVREYLRYSKKIRTEDDSEALTIEEGCAVTLDEFLEASNILLAYSFKNSQDTTIQEFFYCENDCSHNNGYNGFCKGEFSLSNKSNRELKLCEYYSDSQYI